MYDPKILKQVEGEVKPIYAEIKAWTHGFKHVSGVVKAAKDLAEMEGADPVLCQIAAYCHDLGRLEEEEKNLVNPKPGTPSAHAVFSVKPTNKILDKVGIKGKDREKILEAVKLHNIRKYEGDNEILLVIQDADRADGFGKLAILRFATFNCEMLIPEPQNPKEVDEDFEKMMSILKEDHI
ncbi:MAG: HD domain-containing protein, partial [Candidatus Berkelbacteria bacterium]|nr:HD domain-containing protein [Candidatus Berkelbacteria bacterium]